MCVCVCVCVCITSSSCQTVNTDIPDPLSLPVSITHHSFKSFSLRPVSAQSSC